MSNSIGPILTAGLVVITLGTADAEPLPAQAVGQIMMNLATGSSTASHLNVTALGSPTASQFVIAKQMADTIQEKGYDLRRPYENIAASSGVIAKST